MTIEQAALLILISIPVCATIGVVVMVAGICWRVLRGQR
jgi:hypothetical protein